MTPEMLDTLLESLDADRESAGAKYEELRRKLIRFFEWRGVAFPDEQADETLDRVSKRLTGGVRIGSVSAYAYEVARLVGLETFKAPAHAQVALDEAALGAPEDTGEQLEKERRMECLEECLRRLPSESRQLILEYYRGTGLGRIDSRRAFAHRLGLQRDALANRAQRIRNRLEACVAKCLERTGAI
jgi:DNA-directed RNA polymerase specialized sigma24 family protein